MRRQRKKSSRFGSVILGIFLLVFLLGCLGWVYRSNLLTFNLKVTQAKYGSIEHIEEVTAIFANEEVLIRAPVSGIPEYVGKEGERFRRGDIVAYMKSQGVSLGNNQSRATVVAPAGGILYRNTDGLESILAPENLMSMNLNKLMEQNSIEKDSEEIIQTGAPIGKIVNNLRATLAFVKLSSIEGIKIGDSLRFTINGQAYRGKVLRISDEPRGIVVEFSQYIDGTAKDRVQEISWIVKSVTEGVLLPKQTMFTMGEERGVFVVVGGRIQFRNLVPIDEDEQYVCFSEEDLPNGIPVILNPREGIDGLTMKL